MTENKEEMIDVEPICKQFKQYIDIDSRSILSAKFGDGKSYFLSQFTRLYSDDYLFITIYPVNYQVMDNGEIFELVKRDILLRLLSENSINSSNIEFTKSFKTAYYLSQSYEEIFGDLIKIIPHFNFCGLDIDLENIYNSIKSLRHGYKEWEKNIDETTKEKADKFIKDFNYGKGSIYEFDAISQLIYNIISGYKESSGKKVVLIIEDLDRIDPAHIFRILNVFSAHFDNQLYGESNKYNFDKIITVCDYNNIKNIYHYVYGEKTDFIGYISKFSNKEPFCYSIHKHLKKYILDNLLDPSLLKYTNICDVLCDNIISSLSKETDSYNLRIIKQRLIKAHKTITTKNIKLDKTLKDFSLKSSNTLAYLVAITKSFNIDVNNMLSDKLLTEIIELIGSGWLLLSIFNSEFVFDKDLLFSERKIAIIINKQIMHNSYEYYEVGFFYILMLTGKNNIIDEVKFSINNNATKITQEHLFKHKNKVLDYYKNNLVL